LHYGIYLKTIFGALSKICNQISKCISEWHGKYTSGIWCVLLVLWIELFSHLKKCSNTIFVLVALLGPSPLSGWRIQGHIPFQKWGLMPKILCEANFFHLNFYLNPWCHHYVCYHIHAPYSQTILLKYLMNELSHYILKCNTKLGWRLWCCDMLKSLVKLSVTHQLWLLGGDEVNGGIIATSHVVHNKSEGLCNVRDFVRLKWPFSDHLTSCFPRANAMVTFRGLVWIFATISYIVFCTYETISMHCPLFRRTIGL
jgi:hypothetical protein